MLADLFPPRERWGLGWVLCASLATAFFEAVGVASILPFMAYVLDPAALDRYPMFTNTVARLGVVTPESKLLLVGSVTVAIVAAGNLAAAANVYLQHRFAGRTEARLSAHLFAGYLRQPYAFHVRRDAPSMLKVLNEDIRAVLSGVITPLMLAISKISMALFLLALLILRDPAIAFLVASGLCLTYWSIFRVLRNAQSQAGRRVNEANETRARIAQEGFGGVKELRVLGREDVAIGGFAEASREVAGARAVNAAASQLPRYALETVAFGGILLITLALVARSAGTAQAAVPMLALYAFAGYRLMPALQQMMAAAVSVRFYVPALQALHADFKTLVGSGDAPLARKPLLSAPSGRFESLSLEGVTFTYEGASSPAVREITLTIHRNESIGLVGRTGSGKTTLADLVLGLHCPTVGVVKVNGLPLTDNALQSWQQRVGYVPQTVFLANTSIAGNIAFGLAPEEIDSVAVRRAARLAQMEDFIGTLLQGYDTTVGERGVRLSGGQRQRIGIARALYHDPDVLVFDEATSSLDGLTEDAVMEAIRLISGERTVILIAHRLRTVQAADRILMLDGGQVVASGSFNQLATTSAAFRELLGRSGGTVSEEPVQRTAPALRYRP